MANHPNSSRNVRKLAGRTFRYARGTGWFELHPNGTRKQWAGKNWLTVRRIHSVR